MTVNKNDIKSAIRSLGLSSNCVCLHSSLKSFGCNIDGGADAVIDGFLEEGCTVLVPTFSYDYDDFPPLNMRPGRNGVPDYGALKIEDYNAKKIFTTESNDFSQKDMGHIPYTLLSRQERRRGYHPLNSFATIGKFAEELISCQSPLDVYAPLERLCELNGYVLMMGVKLNRATIIHYAEQLAGRELFIRWYKTRDEKTDICKVGSCSEAFENFSSHLKSVEKNIKLQNSLWRVFDAKAMTEICTRVIKEQPDITHCGDSNCERCDDAVAGGPVWE